MPGSSAPRQFACPAALAPCTLPQEGITTPTAARTAGWLRTRDPGKDPTSVTISEKSNHVSKTCSFFQSRKSSEMRFSYQLWCKSDSSGWCGVKQDLKWSQVRSGLWPHVVSLQLVQEGKITDRSSSSSCVNCHRLFCRGTIVNKLQWMELEERWSRSRLTGAQNTK